MNEFTREHNVWLNSEFETNCVFYYNAHYTQSFFMFGYCSFFIYNLYAQYLSVLSVDK